MMMGEGSVFRRKVLIEQMIHTAQGILALDFDIDDSYQVLEDLQVQQAMLRKQIDEYSLMPYNNEERHLFRTCEKLEKQIHQKLQENREYLREKIEKIQAAHVSRNAYNQSSSYQIGGYFLDNRR